jgi:hypothetical protein
MFIFDNLIDVDEKNPASDAQRRDVIWWSL